jgi:hypothetical protein
MSRRSPGDPSMQATTISRKTERQRLMDKREQLSI